MAEQNLGPRDFFAKEDAIADLGLIACPGAEELCKLVDSHLVRWAREVGNDAVDTFIIPCDCPRFQSGDAKGLVKASTRGDDLYIFVDPGNYSVTYKLFGYENHLSPDDHFQNLMRIIQAVSGRAHRISVIMPSLYGGRQHRRVSRESLDCAFSLQQLRAVGVKNIITFDAHDPRVMNAVPTMSFDNVMPTYQVLPLSVTVAAFGSSSQTESVSTKSLHSSQSAPCSAVRAPSPSSAFSTAPLAQ